MHVFPQIFLKEFHQEFIFRRSSRNGSRKLSRNFSRGCPRNSSKDFFKICDSKNSTEIWKFFREFFQKTPLSFPLEFQKFFWNFFFNFCWINYYCWSFSRDSFRYRFIYSLILSIMYLKLKHSVNNLCKNCSRILSIFQGFFKEIILWKNLFSEIPSRNVLFLQDLVRKLLGAVLWKFLSRY